MATPVTTMNGQKPAGKSAATKLRTLLSDPSKILVAPGVYDGLTARIALREGFDCESFPYR
jgi:2-methylisocitrate lyase-like PEP mutase family enzyme